MSIRYLETERAFDFIIENVTGEEMLLPLGLLGLNGPNLTLAAELSHRNDGIAYSRVGPTPGNMYQAFLTFLPSGKYIVRRQLGDFLVRRTHEPLTIYIRRHPILYGVLDTPVPRYVPQEHVWRGRLISNMLQF